MATETPPQPSSDVAGGLQGGAALVEGGPVGGGTAVIEGRTQWQIFWNRFKRHRLGLAAGGVLGVLMAMAYIYPLVSPYAFDEKHIPDRRTGPGWPYILGTNELGEDLFTQVMHGGRISITVGLLTAVTATLIGTALGAAAGYFGGWVDALISRVTDVFLAAPALAVLIALAAVFDELTLTLIILVIAALSWMPIARLVRAEFLGLKEREFVQAARAMGASPLRIIWRHVLPNALSVVIVAATLLVGLAIIIEATLSYLGIGIDPLSNPSWGNLLEDARNNVQEEWWLVLFPGAAIVLTVLCVNFLGDALRDALDPYAHRGGRH